MVLIAGSIFIIPFLYSSATIDPVLTLRFTAWAILTFLMIAMTCLQNQRMRISFDYGMMYRAVFPILTGYLLISALSLIKAINLTEGIFEWLKIFLSIAFFHAACLIIGTRQKAVLNLTKAMTLAGILLSAVGICQYLDLAFTFIPGNYKIYATMANKNLFSSILFLMLPFALYGALRYSGVWKKVGLAAIALIGLSIAIAGSRAVWAALLVSTAAVCSLKLVYQKKRITSEKYSFINRLGLIVCPGFIVLGIILGANACDQKSGSILSTASLAQRIRLWDKSLKMTAANPFLGVGLGQWKIIYPGCATERKGQDPDERSAPVYFQRPHNDYLWVLSESGFGGLLCYLAFFVTLIFYCIRIIHKAHNPDTIYFSILMLFGITGYTVISFFSFPKERIVHNIFLMLTAACILTVYQQLFPIRKKIPAPGFKGLNIVILCMLAVCAAVGYIRICSEVHARRALSAKKVGRWQQVIYEIDKADLRFYNMDPIAMPLSGYKGLANFSLGHIEKAREDFRKALQAHPNHIYVLNNLGTCSALLNDYRRAIEYYNRSLAISPGFKQAQNNLHLISGQPTS
jgi:O-antigen ligase